MYQTTVDGVHHELGTSGFLYRSNKLMYDHKTKSLWSTLMGKPVVGPLVQKNIELTRRHVVTTTWGEWRLSNPTTTVLSLDTGHARNYGEGVAYKNYFSTDRLMFAVPETDSRLNNKDEVLALRTADQQLGISTDFLINNQVFQETAGDLSFVVLTDDSGANRVYESRDVKFDRWDGRGVLTDNQGDDWDVDGADLTNGARKLNRLPAHRAFWFGWYAQFPKTRLIQ